MGSTLKICGQWRTAAIIDDQDVGQEFFPFQRCESSDEANMVVEDRYQNGSGGRRAIRRVLLHVRGMQKVVSFANTSLHFLEDEGDSWLLCLRASAYQHSSLAAP